MPLSTRSVADLKNRSIPSQSSDDVSGTFSDRPQFRKLRKLLSPRYTSDIFELFDNLSNMFYNETPDTSLFECLHSCITVDDLEKPVLALLKECYIFLTHSPDDVGDVSHPKEICAIFKNLLWQATYAANLSKPFSEIYSSPQKFMTFRFPSISTGPCYQYAAITMYWKKEYYNNLSPHHKASMDTVLNSIPLTQTEILANPDPRVFRLSLVSRLHRLFRLEIIHLRTPSQSLDEKKGVDCLPAAKNNETKKAKVGVDTSGVSKNGMPGTRRSTRLQKKPTHDSSDLAIATVLAETQQGKFFFVYWIQFKNYFKLIFKKIIVSIIIKHQKRLLL